MLSGSILPAIGAEPGSDHNGSGFISLPSHEIMHLLVPSLFVCVSIRCSLLPFIVLLLPQAVLGRSHNFSAHGHLAPRPSGEEKGSRLIHSPSLSLHSHAPLSHPQSLTLPYPTSSPPLLDSKYKKRQTEKRRPEESHHIPQPPPRSQLLAISRQRPSSGRPKHPHDRYRRSSRSRSSLNRTGS